ncbi:MAG: cytochrome c oxidase subunit 3 [Acidimicrobiales bacterium]
MSVVSGTVAHTPASGGEGHLELKARQWRLAVVLFLVSDFVFVAALFFSYLYLRLLNVNHMWRPAGVNAPPLAENAVLALLVVAGAAAWRFADLGIRQGSQQRLKTGSLLALVLAALDLVAQVWQLTNLSFGPGSGAFASAFIVLAGYHVFHLLVLLLIGAGLLSRVLRGRYSAADYTQVQVFGYFFYWVAVMAVGMAVLPK